MSEKILVTGGCGFIGSNIVRALLNEDYRVKIIDDLSTGKKAYVKDCLEDSNCEFIHGSITNLATVEKQMKDVNTVIHEAANPDVRASTKNLFSVFETNVKGTINILSAMAKEHTPKIIFASSAGTVYGETDVIPTPETLPLEPISHYGASKAASEQYISSFSSLYGIEAFSLRLGNIFGPPSNHGVVYDFFKKLQKDSAKLEILGDGQQIKSYLYVEDCVKAHLKALETTVKGHVPLNISTNEGVTVIKIAEIIVEALQLKDVSFTFTGGERGWAGDVRKTVADISKAKTILQWEPKISIKDGIYKYISWLKNLK
ncbi:MAG: SDR family NAD(P)-dependent oxidoreductase [Asgard group archaeon]|nr:SDR family NAD(P)-dependent oxidoreductase [Asgard group archaeon]